MKSFVIGKCLGIETNQTNSGKGVVNIGILRNLDAEKFVIFEQEKGDNKLYKAALKVAEGEHVLLEVNHFVAEGKEKKYINQIYTGEDVLLIDSQLSDLKITA